MRDIVILFLHLIVTWMQLARPGSIRSVVAEYVLVKHQALILNRSRKRAPNLRASDRIIAGLCALLMRPARVVRSAIVLSDLGLPRIAQQITLAFGIQINKDVVRRVLGRHYQPDLGSAGPSWLNFIGQLKDSLWSVDLFRCEPATLDAREW